MKLYESERMTHMFQNVIKELRKETGHLKDFINGSQFEELKQAWKRSKNRAEAKAWMRVILMW